MKESLRILYVEPFLGGSHESFVNSWRTHSHHEFEIFGLPAYKWKWRMRHGPLTLASQVNAAADKGKRWDVVVCSDMLALAEFKGMVHPEISFTPAVCYFHENQLTYPTSGAPRERDFHFAFTNFVTASVADENWFNSAFHMNSFFDTMKSWLNQMPDFKMVAQVETARAKSIIQFPGVEPAPTKKRIVEAGPVTILWPHRWEFDKNPDEFFESLELLKTKIDFRLIVLGESFRQQPQVFERAKSVFAEQIIHWGFVESRVEYEQLVASADIVVSTAQHEFFGMAMLEAASAGVIPIVPIRLAYPEIFQYENSRSEPFFYDGTVNGLVAAILNAEILLKDEKSFKQLQAHLQTIVSPFEWSRRAQHMDERLTHLVNSRF